MARFRLPLPLFSPPESGETARAPSASVSPAPASDGPLAQQEVHLPAGTLTVAVTGVRVGWSLDSLCGFASRRNPKRRFLFVSKVLGRHIPVRPALMRQSWSDLAAALPADLPGPVVMIGMAETAVALGQGVHEVYRTRTGRKDVVFLPSTRYRLDHPLALDFVEAHSHATDHRLYAPADPETRALFYGARSLVLIDDETSTGATFINLAQAFAANCPHLSQVVTVVLTDWSGAAGHARMQTEMPVPVSHVSLLEGHYRFTLAPDAPEVTLPNVTGNDGDKTALLTRNWGRLGRCDSPEVPPEILQGIDTGPGERVLVLGTGEFVYPPFRLAEALAEKGADVWYQSTTRSPILNGHAIGCAVEFLDNYEDGIPNFVYNARQMDYDRVLVGLETPPATAPAALASALGAQFLYF